MDKIKIYIFHTGQVRVDRAIPLHERNPLAVTGFFRSTKKQMVLPVSAYLIVHPKGNILIDTGWDTKYAHERPKQLMGMVDKISAPIIRENEGIDSKLKSVGLSVADIDHVFISHMDFDHASGLRLVRTARDIRTAQEGNGMPAISSVCAMWTHGQASAKSKPFPISAAVLVLWERAMMCSVTVRFSLCIHRDIVMVCSAS